MKQTWQNHAMRLVEIQVASHPPLTIFCQYFHPKFCSSAIQNTVVKGYLFCDRMTKTQKNISLMMMTMMMMMMMNCFCGMVDRRKVFSLIPAETIVRDPRHRETPTRREQGLNLRRT